MDRGTQQTIVLGVTKELDTTVRTNTFFHFHFRRLSAVDNKVTQSRPPNDWCHGSVWVLLISIINLNINGTRNQYKSFLLIVPLIVRCQHWTPCSAPLVLFSWRECRITQSEETVQTSTASAWTLAFTDALNFETNCVYIYILEWAHQYRNATVFWDRAFKED